MIKLRPITFQKRPDDIWIGGCSLKDLANQFGTPLYVIDEQTIRHNCRLFTKTLDECYPDYNIIYASKAGLNIGIANIIASENCGADVVSGGELYTVLNSNIEHDKIYFHGNNKSKSELTLAIKNHVKIIVDNAYELSLIEQVSNELSIPALVMFRFKPGIEAHTHEYIKTGQIDSKFGMEYEEVIPLIQSVMSSNWAHFIGIHAHIGSQIFDDQPFYDLVDILFDYTQSLLTDYNIPIEELNLGGGFGIQYIDSEQAPEIPKIITKMALKLKTLCANKSINLPRLIFEPGRSIIANAGITIYSVGAIKSIPNIKDYLFVDGGMADNPRPMMYKSEYTFDVVNPKSPNRKAYTIAGKFCESGDILASDIELPIVSPDDHIVVYGTGAYNYSMASNYNRFCKPAMVSINNGTSTLLVRRETYEDIIRLDQ